MPGPNEINPEDLNVSLPNLPPTSFDGGPSSTSAPDVNSVSSIQSSEKEHERDMTIAVLPEWKFNQEYMDFLKNGIQIDPASGTSTANIGALSNIVTAMAGNWVDNVQSIKKDIKIERSSPLAQSLADFNGKIKSGEGSNDVAAVTSMLIIAATFIGVAAGSAVASTSEVSFNVIQDAVSQVIPLLPGNMAAELGLIGALFATGAMYQAAWMTIAQGGKSQAGNGSINAKFARNYADRTIATVTGQTFNDFVKSTIISKMKESGETMSDERKDQIIAMIKVTLLFNALALMTKVEVGHLTVEELAAMILGKITFKQKDQRTTLVSLIKDSLTKLVRNERERLVGALLAYYNSNPKLESLADPVKAFEGIFENLDEGKITQQAA